MIPLHLTISGFLSYREAVELDLTGIDLACISGANGAGKSSLLDAITWVLFGEARKRDDSVINSGAKAAEVRLVFEYEGLYYRVLRSKPREKTMLLEFHILQRVAETGSAAPRPWMDGVWKSITEHSLRETEKRIGQILRLDYETFVNASFFLQGKADQFTQQRPGDRKRILGSILGLEQWETYRAGALEQRRQLEDEMNGIDGQLREINVELGEGPARRARLDQLEKELTELRKNRLQQESQLQTIRQFEASLESQQKSVAVLDKHLQEVKRSLAETTQKLGIRQQERLRYNQVLDQADRIEAAHRDWQALQKRLAEMEQIADRFREHEKRRAEPREQIQAERARLEQELMTLRQQDQDAQANLTRLEELKHKLEDLRSKVSAATSLVEQRAHLDESRQLLIQQTEELKAENKQLKVEMEGLDERINKLIKFEGAVCPFCGQPLSDADRARLVIDLRTKGGEMGDRFRANQVQVKESESNQAALQKQIAGLVQIEQDNQRNTETLAKWSTEAELLERRRQEWSSSGAVRLVEVASVIEKQQYAPDARRKLAEIDAELRQIGYDPQEHDLVRQAEVNGRTAEEELRILEKARAALEPLDREIGELVLQSSRLDTEVKRQQVEYDQALHELQATEAKIPDYSAAEANFLQIQERENSLSQEVGGARQRVSVLQDLKKRKQELESQREDKARLVGQYKQLERAFGKDGVPSLLIEQALPQIEAKANEILDRLSGGNMSVSIQTQAPYKDKRREDLRETLDIRISDSAGVRDYEMFSGGEAFRVNFAIRLALSEVLAQRAGARLQTLVIDEGFGSQDAQGRQRLVEAINLVRQDFTKILVITHIDELKDAFSHRIEVEKTSKGSTLRII